MAQHPSHGCGCSCSRRTMLKTSAAAVGAGLGAMWFGNAIAQHAPQLALQPAGPGAHYRPRLKAAFVRREGEFGMSWPGAVYDGEAALARYTGEIEAAAKDVNLDVDIAPKPFYSEEAGQQWLQEAQAQAMDGLVLVLLDRQRHAWPTAYAAVASGLPTVIFAPLGAAFTTNTDDIANAPGCMISCSSDFSQARRGMKAIGAGAKLREMRYVVLRGTDRLEERLPVYGTRCRYVPAAEFVDRYRNMPVTPEIEEIADDYASQAVAVYDAQRQDIVNGVKSLLVASALLIAEEADGISMDCLGALGKTDISLPCIAWSWMLDHRIPAACEADPTAFVTHAIAQFLLDRPGFQQDPVPETVHGWLTGAH